jgi:hypothetical protein
LYEAEYGNQDKAAFREERANVLIDRQGSDEVALTGFSHADGFPHWSIL